MPMYLWRASYAADGAKGLLKDGGTKRRDAVKSNDGEGRWEASLLPFRARHR